MLTRTEELLGQLDGQSISTELVTLVRETRELLEHLTNEGGPIEGALASWRTLTTQLGDSVAAAQVDETSRSLRDAAAKVGGAATAVRSLGADAGTMTIELEQDLASLRETLEALRALAMLLERDPGALLRGRARGTSTGVRPMRQNRTIACLLLSVLAACISTNDPPRIRYFAVDTPEPAAAPASGLHYRLRRTRSAAHLRERMVWRRSEVEYGFAEDRRWTEAPITYVERAVQEGSSSDGARSRSEALSTPALDIELFAFDELLAPAHVARVAFALRLIAPDGNVLLDRTFARDDRIEGRAPEDVAEAMSRALAAAASEAADALVSALQ